MTRAEEKVDKVLKSLKKSQFRNKFHLKEKDLEYIKEKKLSVIKDHTYDIVRKRLAPAIILNDGKQTPTKGHPVFTAQHATATCCRSCLYKWHKIEKNRQLTENEINYIVYIIMTWIQNEIKKNI